MTTDVAVLSLAEFADHVLPDEAQYEIDDDGQLTFTPAGEAYWRPLFHKWGYDYSRSLPGDEFEDISTLILMQEMQGLRAAAAPCFARPCAAA
jgi:hypothetical protein